MRSRDRLGDGREAAVEVAVVPHAVFHDRDDDLLAFVYPFNLRAGHQRVLGGRGDGRRERSRYRLDVVGKRRPARGGQTQLARVGQLGGPFQGLLS